MNTDIVLWSLMNGIISNIDLKENYLIKFLVFIVFIYNAIPRYYRNSIFSKLKRKILKTRNCVILEHNDDIDKATDKFVAIIEYISKNCKEIKSAKELETITWDKDDNRKKTSFYRVDQFDPFLITDNIYGEYEYCERVEGGRRGGNAVYTKIISTITIFSYIKTTRELIQWIDEIEKIRNKEIIDRFKKNQYIIKIDSKLTVTTKKFTSNATFDNSYAPFQEKVLNSLQFFEENEEYYKSKGIPYTLGIAAVGIPGGGKTRLLKQILNYTKRHGVIVELSEDFDMSTLEQIMHGIISDSINFEPSEFIIIFEDLDTSTSMLNERKEEVKADSEDKKPKNNVNLGKILNMIDGVCERDGGMIFFSSNYHKKFDKAFLRPGRFDLFVECKHFTRSQIHKLCQNYWKEEYTYKAEDIHDEIIDKYSSAELLEIFREALNDFENIKKLIIRT